MQCLALNHGKIRGTSSANCLPPNHYEHERFAMAAPILTQEYLKSILHYDPATGVFTRRADNNGWKAGEIAGGDDGHGYIALEINGRAYRAHRLAFLYMEGSFPQHQADHINGIRHDNRWENLRAVTNAENQRNGRPRRNNTSGYMGVSQQRASGRWLAYISVNGKKKYLGIFAEISDAIAAREAANVKYNYHANHGRHS
jgi:hypothetical protein